MRILTVQQPWARAIIDGDKDTENRGRNIAGTYRGPVAIHAGKVYNGLGAEAMYMKGLVPDDWRDLLGSRWEAADWHLGAIIGVVDLVGVHDSRLDGCGTRAGTVRLGERIPLCSEWAEPWSHHLVLANARSLPEPIPYRGALGLRTLPADMTARILTAIGEPA